MFLQLPYSTALAAVFIEGWIFVILSLTGVRAAVIRLVPRCASRMQTPVTCATPGDFPAACEFHRPQGICSVTDAS